MRSASEQHAYWRDVGTVDAYWAANIDLTDFVPQLDLYDRNWPIWTYGEITPPAKFVHDQVGRRGQALSSLVSGGCIISGATLRRTLLFTGVRVNSYATVENAVVLLYVDVGRSARLANVVVDRGVQIPQGLIVGALPLALAAEDVETRTLIPGYPEALAALRAGETVHEFKELFGGPAWIHAARLSA